MSNDPGLYIRWKDIWTCLGVVLESNYNWLPTDILHLQELVDVEFQKVIRNGHDPTQFNGRLAPRENVKKYKKEIRQILSIIGKPDIWVTDNTTLGSLGLENEVVGELAKFIYNPSGNKDTPLLLSEAPIWQFARDLRGD